LDDENLLWSVVALARNSPGPISDSLLTEISSALARVRHEARLNDVIAEQALDVLQKAGVKPNYSFPLDEGATRADLIRALRTYGCKPLTVGGNARSTALAAPSAKG
jgi:hypothetical protein